MGHRTFILLLALFAPSLSHAVTANLSWDAPTQYTDNSPLDQADIAAYRIYYEIDAIVTEASTTVDVSPGNGTSLTITLTPRPTAYVVYFAARTVLKDGRTSDFSNMVTRTYIVRTTANPSPPTNLILQIICDAGCTITDITP